ncbi:MAG: DUF1385 domain-containing protein [Oscillospiraceae bacterium]
MKENNKVSHKSKIGGQALIEGIMMRGLDKASMAVRKPDGEIDVETWNLKKQSIFNKIPIVRGMVNFIQSMFMGYKCLSKSAEKAGIDDDENYEPSKFEKWLDDKLGDKLMGVITIVGTVLGVILSFLLFMYLPSLLVKGLDVLIPIGAFKALIEGIIKIMIFIIYLSLVGKMKEIRRVYEYHGAEHKTIFCYENGLPLTVENVKIQSRFHPRCGTSFIIIVLILSILIFSVVTWSSIWMRTLIKLALLPIVVGIAYELIKVAGRYDNWLTRIISYPGIKLQNLTTCEPDDSQIEVAIAAMEAVIPDNKEDDQW